MFVCFVLVILLGKRILQTMRALRRSPRQPDFEGLEAFLGHMGRHASGQLHTPVDDWWVVELQKTEATIAKQARLTQEGSQPRRVGGGGGGGGGAATPKK